jgi:hypothetical protein
MGKCFLSTHHASLVMYWWLLVHPGPRTNDLHGVKPWNRMKDEKKEWRSERFKDEKVRGPASENEEARGTTNWRISRAIPICTVLNYRTFLCISFTGIKNRPMWNGIMVKTPKPTLKKFKWVLGFLPWSQCGGQFILALKIHWGQDIDLSLKVY